MPLSRRQTLLSLMSGAALAPFGLLTSPALADDTVLIGIWSGTLTVGPGVRINLVVGEGNKVALILVDQNHTRVPATGGTIKDDTLNAEFQSAGASYSGKLKDKDHLEGTFTLNGAAIALTFHRGDDFVPVIPPLTPALLHATRLKSNTPAMGAAWQHTGHTPTILVDGPRASNQTVVVQPGDQWHLGSISKSMTATLAARLVDAGKLDWTTTVGSILSPTVPDMLAPYKFATILHLLSHHAGLQANLAMANMALYSRNDGIDPRPDRLKFAAEALGQTPIAAPGQAMIYSNSGYIIAAAMMETIMQRSWEDLMSDYVFKPLGLTSGGFGPPGHPGQTDQPVGHGVKGGAYVPLPSGPGVINDNVVAFGPAGRVHMSLGDIITYLEAHRDTPESFLKAASWAKLHTPPFGGDYALGWTVKPDGRLWHNGTNTLWYAEVLIDKTKGLVSAITANDGTTATQAAVAQLMASASIT